MSRGVLLRSVALVILTLPVSAQTESLFISAETPQASPALSAPASSPSASPSAPAQEPPAAPASGQAPAPAAASDQAPPAGSQVRPPAPPKPGFRTGVDVVALNVTVTDLQQRPMGGLQRDDFAVYEDGVQQEIAYFEASEVPLDLAILVDTSASMVSRLPLVQRAATGFAEVLRQNDRAAIIGFNDRVTVLQEFTSDLSSLKRAIQQTNAGGATALYNAVYVTLKEFTRLSLKDKETDSRVRRRAMVVLSDGEDTVSLLSFDELMNEAHQGGVTIYTIGLHLDPLAGTSNVRRYFSQADFTLKSLAQETGARSFFPIRNEDVQDAYDVIGRELAQQYALGYVSKNPIKNGAFRRVIVQIVGRPEARPRTRAGYLAGVWRGLTTLVK